MLGRWVEDRVAGRVVEWLAKRMSVRLGGRLVVLGDLLICFLGYRPAVWLVLGSPP